ncbi:MAG: tRNA/rRNA methyltransferase (SpoU) [Acidimicrobiaceae bacterium]|nr:tRNA/rRNA methyltransferase (SpoU) [Acidimicrobiaceae bacterium]
MAGPASGPLVRIEDPDDPRLVGYRNLKDPELRKLRGEDEAIFVVESRLAVRQLLASPYVVCSLLVDDHKVASSQDLVVGVRAVGAPVYVADRDMLAATVGFPLHRGVVAIARRPAAIDGRRIVGDALAHKMRGSAALFVVLEGVNDHENLGSLFRNAAAFGVAAVLLDPTSADPLYRRSVRVSLGHVLTVPFGRLAPWPDALEELREDGILVVALSPHPERTAGINAGSPGGLRGLARRAGERPVALLVGAEGDGLSAAALAVADQVVTVPMATGVDSLNVATAAAIAFYELTVGDEPRE